jgi:AbrB family looped-hinge helix DNA binding protein
LESELEGSTLREINRREVEGGERMQSVITSKFQTTIPKAVRENLKLSVRDALEWKVQNGKVVVYPAQKKFLQYRNTVKIGKGDISADIERARTMRAERCR